jgi:hypothetical protein
MKPPLKKNEFKIKIMLAFFIFFSYFIHLALADLETARLSSGRNGHADSGR